MKGKYLRKIGGLALSVLMLFGIAFLSSSEAQAQRRRRIVIVRPYPYRIYRPFGFGYRNWWGYPYGWGYDPWGYNFRYSHYVFDDSERAGNQGYKDGFKTGQDDGKKDKSYDPQRSHYFKEAGFGNFAEVYRSAFSRGYQDGYRVGNSRAG
jgi:ribosome modulation factor